MWARDTFRNTILDSLASCQTAVKIQTPIAPAQDTAATLLRLNIDTDGEQLDQSLETHEKVDVAMDLLNFDSSSAGTDGASTPPSNCSFAQDSAVDVTTSTESLGRKYGLTRHACQVRFEFVHVILPDALDRCMKLLRCVHGDSAKPTVKDLQAEAQALFKLFNSKDVALSLDADQISLLRNKWVMTATNTSSLLPRWGPPVQTLVSFSSEFDRNTWHITRRLTCVSCSAAAAETLLQITGQAYGASFTDIPEDMMLFNQVQEALTAVRCLPSELSIQTALQSRSLYLSFDEITSSRQWAPICKKLSTTLNPIVNFARTDYTKAVQPQYAKYTALEEVCPRSTTVKLSTLLGSNINESDGAVLLKKPDHWPEATEEWCLLALEAQSLKDTDVVSDLLALAVDKGQVYDLPKGRNIPHLCRNILEKRSEQRLLKWREALICNPGASLRD